MKLLLDRPKQAVMIGVTLVALAATVVIFILMRPHEGEMQEQGGYGIVSYELAYSADKADDILTAWGPGGEKAARSSLLIDYAFMPSYALLFTGITLLIARAQLGGLQGYGLWLVPGQIAAALFDALENAMLLTMLGTAGNVPAVPPVIAGISATLKFLLLALAILYWIVCGLAWVVRRLRPVS